MKKAIQSYISFTRTERIGLICLCGLLVVLLFIRFTLPYWVVPAGSNSEEKKLVAAWEVFKSTQQKVSNRDTLNSPGEEYMDAADDNSAPLPAVININTADSPTLVRLKGIGPVTAGKIIRWRKQHGRFTNVSQLLEVHAIPQSIFKILKKHLSVCDTLK